MDSKEERQSITVIVEEDEDFIDRLLKAGEDKEKVERLWHRLQKIKNS